MKRALSFKTVSLLACLLLGGVVATSACSNQGEGERCESLNDNEDCKTGDGLQCYPAAQLNNSTSDRCCPTDRTKATAAVCKTPVDIVGADATAPTDSGPVNTADANVATDASDASTDAPTDG